MKYKYAVLIACWIGMSMDLPPETVGFFRAFAAATVLWLTVDVIGDM